VQSKVARAKAIYSFGQSSGTPGYILISNWVVKNLYTVIVDGQLTDATHCMRASYIADVRIN
jgi:hypothetical protein